MNSLSASDSSPKKISKRDIKSLIEDALSKQVKDQAANSRYGADCAESLISVISEFMGNFILIGYDLEMTPITITYAHNQGEMDMLQTALQRYFFKHVDKH